MLQHTAPTAWHPLARTDRTHVLQLEFTTRCDFKCTYCAVSQPQWDGRDLDLGRFDYDGLITSARQRRCRVLNLHGHGETTMLPGWVEHARKAVETGIPVTICSNFGHLHTAEETDVLARFHGITVSIDTVDPVLFKQLRRGGDLRTLLFNLLRLKQRAEDLGTTPHLTFCCVLSDRSWRGLPDLVRQGLSLGVRTFCICNLNLLPTPKGGLQLRHLSELPAPEAAEARELLLRCQSYCKGRGAELHLKAGLLDTLERRLA